MKIIMATKKKKCTAGFSCGRTCIQRKRTCKSNLDAKGKRVVENYTQFLNRLTSESQAKITPTPQAGGKTPEKVSKNPEDNKKRKPDLSQGEQQILKDLDLPPTTTADALRGEGWKPLVEAAKENPTGVDAADVNNAVNSYNLLKDSTDPSSDLLRAAVLRAGEPWGGSGIRSDIHNGAKDRLRPVIQFKKKTDEGLGKIDDDTFESGVQLLEDGPVNGRTPDVTSATTVAAHSVMKDIWNNAEDPAQKLRILGSFTPAEKDLDPERVFSGDATQQARLKNAANLALKFEESVGLSLRGMTVGEIRELIDDGVIDVDEFADDLKKKW